MKAKTLFSPSCLYNEQTFYKMFIADVSKAKHLVIIESPFLSTKRFLMLSPELIKVSQRGVRIIVNTRNPAEHGNQMHSQAIDVINMMHKINIEILYTAGLHRKLAIIDNAILWQGSLNILSQSDSCEIMQRLCSESIINETVKFTKMTRWYT